MLVAPHIRSVFDVGEVERGKEVGRDGSDARYERTALDAQLRLRDENTRGVEVQRART